MSFAHGREAGWGKEGSTFHISDGAHDIIVSDMDFFWGQRRAPGYEQSQLPTIPRIRGPGPTPTISPGNAPSPARPLARRNMKFGGDGDIPTSTQDLYQITLYKMMWVHADARNPAISVGESAILGTSKGAEIINCVSYNCQQVLQVDFSNVIDVVGSRWVVGPPDPGRAGGLAPPMVSPPSSTSCLEVVASHQSISLTRSLWVAAPLGATTMACVTARRRHHSSPLPERYRRAMRQTPSTRAPPETTAQKAWEDIVVREEHRQQIPD